MADGLVVLMWVALLATIIVVRIAKNITRGGGAGSRAPRWQPELGYNGTPERPFQPTESGPGIAIDDLHDWLWLATGKSRYMLIEKANIRSWKHEWIQTTHRGKLEFCDNRIVFRLADLTMPVVKMSSFGRDHELAEEWQAHLTTWMNG